MRFAVQNPYAWLGKNSLHPYVGEFILQYKPLLYFNDMKLWALFCARFAKEYGPLAMAGMLPRTVFDLASLNEKADVLLCFNGEAENPKGRAPAGFGGLKIFHVMDHFRNASAQYRALREGGVQYVMGYGDHAKCDPFFQKFYPEYAGRVIPVPFSYGERFADFTPFLSRHNKCVAIGSITPFVDEQALADGRMGLERMAPEAREFFGGKYLQPFRCALRENEESLHLIMDSFLPGAKLAPLYKPTPLPDKSWMPKLRLDRKMEGKRFDYNMVDVLNQYRMYTSCESVFTVAYAKTYEGCAAGCALACADLDCFADLGFEDGKNCLMHRRNDVAHFKERVEWGIAHPDELEQIARAGKEMVREKYSSGAVAQRLHEDIGRIFTEWEKEQGRQIDL